MEEHRIFSRVDAILHEQQAERQQLLARLVSIDSTPSNEGEIQEYLLGWLDAEGFEPRALPVDPELVRQRAPKGMAFVPVGGPNVIGTFRGGRAGRTLLLNGHCDTVPFGDASHWTRPPLSALIEDGMLWGRGACDMKAGIAAALFAMRAVKQAGVKLGGDVSFLSTVGEESGSAGAIAFTADCRKYDAAIIGEPTSLIIAPANSGSLHAKVFLRGEGTHAGVRESGVSAIGKFTDLFHALGAFEDERNARLEHPLYTEVRNKVPVNVGVVRGGTWAAMVPESVECHVRIGVMPDESLGQVRGEFDEFVQSWARGDRWLCKHPPIVDWSGPQVPGTAIGAESPLVQAMADAYRSTLGTDPEVRGMTYGSDMVHFTEAGQIPTVVFGPGDIVNAHRVNEYVPLDQFDSATRVLAAMIVRWCGASNE
jgi:acetylornithine deacetylase